MAYLSFCAKYGTYETTVFSALTPEILNLMFNIAPDHILPVIAGCAGYIFAGGVAHTVTDGILYSCNTGVRKGGKIVRAVQATTYISTVTVILSLANISSKYKLSNIFNIDNNNPQHQSQQIKVANDNSKNINKFEPDQEEIIYTL